MPVNRLQSLLSRHKHASLLSLDRVFIIHVLDLDHQNRLLFHQLPVFLASVGVNVGVVILDSITANFRCMENGGQTMMVGGGVDSSNSNHSISRFIACDARIFSFVLIFHCSSLIFSCIGFFSFVAFYSSPVSAHTSIFAIFKFIVQ